MKKMANLAVNNITKIVVKTYSDDDNRFHFLLAKFMGTGWAGIVTTALLTPSVSEVHVLSLYLGSVLAMSKNSSNSASLRPADGNNTISYVAPPRK
jgi:hypothetical protein